MLGRGMSPLLARRARVCIQSGAWTMTRNQCWESEPHLPHRWQDDGEFEIRSCPGLDIGQENPRFAKQAERGP